MGDHGWMAAHGDPADGGPVARAFARLAAGESQGAREDFETLLRDEQSPAAYEGLAHASWWLDDAATCLSAREAAYRLHRQAGDDVGAARAASCLIADSVLFGRGTAVAHGWLARARQLLAALPEPVSETGWLAVREAELAVNTAADPLVAVELAAGAAALGRQLGDPVIELVGSALLGHAEVLGGRVAEGIERLNAAAVGALAGEVSDPMWVGKVCCWLVTACQECHDLPRAIQWCQRIEELCAEAELPPLFTTCRIMHATIGVVRGQWDDAERGLRAALDEFADSNRQARWAAVAALGELRRRQGRLDEAEELLAQADLAPEALCGRALIRLVRDDSEGAWLLMQRVLVTLPADDRLHRASVLLPAVRAALAAGRRDAALAATDELQAIAERAGGDALSAAAAAARALTSADDAAALRWWQQAVRSFQRAGMPDDEAGARAALARCLAALGDTRAAAEQDATVAAIRQRLAAPGGTGARGGRPLTDRETEVLRLVAQGLSNGRIAARLVLSEHTVHRHMANILTKLGAPTRAAAAAQAVAEGLL